MDETMTEAAPEGMPEGDGSMVLGALKQALHEAFEDAEIKAAAAGAMEFSVTFAENGDATVKAGDVEKTIDAGALEIALAGDGMVEAGYEEGDE